MIITGETEQQMHEMFKKYGMIGDADQSDGRSTAVSTRRIFKG
jgi:hypothetical protein